MLIFFTYYEFAMPCVILCVYVCVRVHLIACMRTYGCMCLYIVYIKERVYFRYYIYGTAILKEYK